MSRPSLELSARQYLEVEKIALGAFAPVAGFMTEVEFDSVVTEMRLPDGRPFPLPVILDVTETQRSTVGRAGVIDLRFRGEVIGDLSVTDRYRPDKVRAAGFVYGTTDTAHPGVAHFMRLGETCFGGAVSLRHRMQIDGTISEPTPAETRALFAEKGWRTITGFQTRNIPHRAHEYLLRLALEVVDGLFVQPLIGWKKAGDCSPLAILTAYRTLIDGFLPSSRILLGVLSTSMRYAGPREAVFHAIIRRNYGCTHFIVGRDHAGVGNYYGRYDAQALVRRFEPELGIAILPFAGPYNCSLCGGIVTERSCPHRATHPDAVMEISGTAVRQALRDQSGYTEWLRPEVLASLRGTQVLIEEDDE